jgi:RNA polymerase sigma-70 factor (ECF subfamily)
MSEDLLSLPDEALLELSLSRPSMFEILLGRYQSQFLSRAQAVVGSKDAAEDVVQEAFIRIYRFAPKFKGDAGSFRAWSLTILMNVARTHYSKGARLRGNVADLTSEHYESLPDTGVHAKEGHQAYAKEVIEKGLQKAPPETAEILRLAFIDDLPYAEIAEKLRISVPAVKTRVHRAKAALRGIIGNAEDSKV